MKKVIIRKLWHGSASVRDYLVREAFKLGDGIIVIFKDEQMTIPWEKLKDGKINSEVFESIHDGKKYRLVDYDWKPDLKQEALFDA